MTSSTEVSLADPESHLWESADILRGPADAADFKTCIFSLLFLKPICDVWDDEYQQTGDATGGEQPALLHESHRLQIPEHCHGNDVHTKATNLGAALLRAMREIAKANPDKPYGMFGDAQWSESNESPTVCGGT